MRRFLSTKKRSSRRFLTNKRIRAAVILGVGAVVLYYLVPRVLFVISAVVMMPVVAVQSWVTHSSGAIPSYLRDRAELVEEIETLEQRLAEAGGAAEEQAFLQEENESLRQLLSGENEDRIMAGVVARPNQLPYDVLVIDQGSDDGIVAGAPVYIGSETVIGFVHKTTAHMAMVTLVTTPNFVSTVFVYGPDIYTNAVGQGGGQLRIGVPQGIALSAGDLVVLPSTEAGLYGEVTHVESRATEPEQYGYVSPSIPLQELHYVAVGRSPLHPIDYETAKAHVEALYTDLFTVPVPEDVLVTLGESATTSTSTAATTSATTSSE